jgi:hypothetical protein
MLLAGIASLTGCNAVTATHESVAVRNGTLTLPWYTRIRSQPDAEGRRRRQTVQQGTRTWQTVVLENRYLRVQVVPALGGAVTRVTYLPTNEDLFFWEGKAKDWVPFWESGVKASFPFREHGIHTVQPASHHIVRHEDGSATVAMWMEFSRYTEPHNAKSYGRFTDQMLSQHVTLRPDENLLSVTYRVTNPAPWKQGWKVWNDALFPRTHTPRGIVQGDARPPTPTETVMIQPVAWFSHHNGDKLRPVTPEGLTIASYEDNDISTFAWDLAAGFTGLWYPSVRVNRLRLFDPATAPGTKFYFRGDRTLHPDRPVSHVFNFIELWGGPHHVFEGVEDWIGPGQARQITHHFTYLCGIGKVAYANRHMAVSLEHGLRSNRLGILPLRPVERLTVTVDGERVMDHRAAAPDDPAFVNLDPGGEPLQVRVACGDEALLDQRLPLTVPDDRTRHEKIRRALALNLPENHEKTGVPYGWGRSILRAKYSAGTLGSGRVALYLGRIDEAIDTLREHLRQVPDCGEGWHLLGCALLEAGRSDESLDALSRAVTVTDPYPAARYYLALHRLADGRRDDAVAQLQDLTAAMPSHWQGRLLLAYLAGTEDGEIGPARALVREDPADPRAWYVLAATANACDMPGLHRSARRTLASLLSEQGAKSRLDEFEAATHGRYVPAKRLQTRPPTADRNP